MLRYQYLMEFQSTPSSRRATKASFLRPGDHKFQSTPSSRRATDVG